MIDNNLNIKVQLEALGLGSTEAQIYITGLSYGHAVSVQELQKRTALKRPTIYHNLSLLSARGLVAKVTSANKTLYMFSPPDQLERNIEDEVREAKSKLHTLASVMKQLEVVQPRAGETHVRHFEGVQGIKTVIDMALYCRAPFWRVIAPVNNIFRELDDAYSRYYVRTRKLHDIMSKTLWEGADPTGRTLTKTEIAQRQPRYLPPLMKGQFDSTIIIFDNKIAMITTMKEQSAVLIESDELTKMFTAMFEGLWASSTPYEGRVR